MAVAMAYPEPEKGGGGKSGSLGRGLETRGFGEERLRLARTVLRFLPELAKDLLAGSKSLAENS